MICTIHQPSVDIFREIDGLPMVSRDKGDNAGMLVYFGPAYPESIDFSAPPDGRVGVSASPEMLMTGLARRGTTEWAGTYQKSPVRAEYVERRAGQIVATRTDQKPSKPKRDLGIGQMITLSNAICS